MAEAAVKNNPKTTVRKTKAPELDISRINTTFELIKDKPLPRLTNSVDELRECHENPHTSADRAYEILSQDPGYTLALFTAANKELKRLKKETASTLEHVIVLLGMPQVIRIGHKLPTFDQIGFVERMWLNQVFSQCHHAGIQARELARLRGSSSTDSAFFAAQMRELYFAHLHLYALDILESSDALTRGAPDPGDMIQKLGQKLAKYWHLPSLTIESYTKKPSTPASVIRMMCQISHLSEMGWYHSLMQQKLENASDSLGMDMDKLVKCVHQSAIQAVRDSTTFDTPHPAARLVEPISIQGQVEPSPMLPGSSTSAAKTRTKPQTSVSRSSVKKKVVPKKSAPTNNPALASVKQLKEMGVKRRPAQEILKFSIQSLKQAFPGSGLVFFLIDKNKNLLRSRMISGMADIRQPITISLDQKHLFQLLTRKAQSAHINETNRAKYKSVLHTGLPLKIDQKDFLIMSLIIEEKPFGLFYIETNSEAGFSNAQYKSFVSICKAATFALEKVKKHA